MPLPAHEIRKHATVKRMIRFWNHVNRRVSPDQCWPWQRHCNNNGYGLLEWSGDGGRVALLAHRVAYAIINGDPPPGMLVLHSCDNPRCCNPRHLFLGTHKDNSDDKIAKGRQSAAPNAGKYGAEHPRSKRLAAKRAAAIALYANAAGQLSMSDVAAQFCIHRQTFARWWWEHQGSLRRHPTKRTLMAPSCPAG